jgi:hypothetical protein
MKLRPIPILIGVLGGLLIQLFVWAPAIKTARAQIQPYVQPPSWPINLPVTTTAATTIKATPGILHTVTINTAGASAVISIFDLATASCTGTPSTNTKAIITLPASGALPGTLLYDGQFVNGICIQSTVASNITATAY